jgi:hypothetical protein
MLIQDNQNENLVAVILCSQAYFIKICTITIRDKINEKEHLWTARNRHIFGSLNIQFNLMILLIHISIINGTSHLKIWQDSYCWLDNIKIQILIYLQCYRKLCKWKWMTIYFWFTLIVKYIIMYLIFKM